MNVEKVVRMQEGSSFSWPARVERRVEMQEGSNVGNFRVEDERMGVVSLW